MPATPLHASSVRRLTAAGLLGTATLLSLAQPGAAQPSCATSTLAAQTVPDAAGDAGDDVDITSMSCSRQAARSKRS